MKFVLTLILFFVGNVAVAEGYKDYTAIFGYAQTTYARNEEDRNEVVETLKKETDANASMQCLQGGFSQAVKRSKYKINETFHGGFAYLSTIKMSAEYGCMTPENDLVCRKVGSTYIVKCCDRSGSCWNE